jgi:hypothetical protein
MEGSFILILAKVDNNFYSTLAVRSAASSSSSESYDYSSSTPSSTSISSG